MLSSRMLALASGVMFVSTSASTMSRQARRLVRSQSISSRGEAGSPARSSKRKKPLRPIQLWKADDFMKVTDDYVNGSDTMTWRSTVFVKDYMKKHFLFFKQSLSGHTEAKNIVWNILADKMRESIEDALKEKCELKMKNAESDEKNRIILRFINDLKLYAAAEQACRKLRALNADDLRFSTRSSDYRNALQKVAALRAEVYTHINIALGFGNGGQVHSMELLIGIFVDANDEKYTKGKDKTREELMEELKVQYRKIEEKIRNEMAADLQVLLRNCNVDENTTLYQELNQRLENWRDGKIEADTWMRFKKADLRELLRVWKEKQWGSEHTPQGFPTGTC